MNRWLGAVQIAAVYIGTIIGAGFATGKEIAAFFTRFGLYGFFTIGLAGLVFIVLGTIMMEKAIDMKAQSYEEFNRYLFGKTLAGGINLLMMMMLIGVCGVMLSGAGAVFEEQLHLSRQTGILVTLFLTFSVMMAGTKGLLSVNTFVVPMMIVFNLLLMSQSVRTEGFSRLFWARPDFHESVQAVIQALSYAAFNLALAQAVLVPVASEAGDKKTVRLGGILGGLFLTILLFSSHFSLVTLPDISSLEIPMAHIVKTSFPSIYFIYVMIIFCEIFTSILGDVYGLEKQLQTYLPVKSSWIFLFILIVIALISRMHYGALLSVLYPVFGYFSLLFIVMLVIKTIKA
ncbi:GerAB/ArcD/ProY family transporter [Heyndrickxia acidiproducens]|uniref:YkvI family membrane protein n=1 Tax=Heyndrickxia acidiproducens TaxID=1121084 RepID=UPI000381E1B6|nr:GerAB/ArcD/ProY family transporter [Heyndrickxia acidiproducens]